MTTARAIAQPDSIGDPWRVEMFGGLRLVRGDQTVTRFRTQKTAALLAYLTYFAGGTHSRELLADRFWPDAEPESARHSLRLALSDLRRLLEPPDFGMTLLIAGRTTVELHPGAVVTDVMQFQQILDRLPHTPEPSERRRLLESAVDLYRGPLLPGMYEEWITPQQIRREEQFAENVLALIHYLEREGDTVAALRRARQAALYLPEYETLQTTIARLQEAAPPADAPLPLTVERLRSEKPRPPLAAGTITVLAVEETESGGGDTERTGRRHGGHMLQISAGMCVLAFGRARDALAALNECRETGRLHRAALHTGEVTPQKEAGRALVRTTEEDAASDPVRLTETLCRAARPGFVVCTETTAHLLRPSLADAVCLTALGMYQLLPHAAPERIFRLLSPNESPGIGNEFPALDAPRADVSNLPLVLTRFLGREHEQEELRSLLSDSAIRLLTLTGTGGTGKTRLALETFRSLTDRFRAGVRAFVPLADLTETDRVPDAVRRALNLPPPVPGLESHVQIADALNRHPCALLFLDNAEHLLSDTEGEKDAAAFITDLLERAPGLVCLVTSRRPLGIAGEREFPVNPLPKEEAVALFVERARAVRPDFVLNAMSTRAVEELCLRLDGLPLAIELAAARAGTLSPAQMLAQLATRLELLTRRGAGGGTARHRSVRTAIQWSYDLLPSAQRRSFARLSVFRGGWTAEAASAVLCLPLPATLDLLDDLRRHSLILAEDAADGSGAMRYRMLETLLAFGAEQLTPEMFTEASRRHTGYFGEFVRMVRRTTHRVENEATSRVERERLSLQCEIERENIRTALTFCRDGAPQDREAGLWMATDIGPEWYYRGYLVETVEWVSTLLQAAEPVPDLLRGIALYYMGFISRVIGKEDKARPLLTEAAELLTPYPDDDYFGWTRANLGLCLTDYGLGEEAERLNREAFAAFQRRDDDIGMASALNNLALIPYRRGDIRAAMPLAEEAMIYARRGDHPIFLAIALNLLSDLRSERGDYLAAIEAGDESLALFRERDCRQFVGMAARDVGYAYLDSADWENAQARFDEAQAAFDESGARYGALTTRLARANVALYRDAPGDREAVESLLSEAEETLARWPYRNLIPHVKAARGVQAFLRKREPLTALPLLQSALAEMRQGDTLGSMIYVLDYLAATHHVLGDSARAARLLSASNILREQLDLPTPPSLRSWRDELQSAVGPLPDVSADWKAIIAAEAEAAPVP